MLIDDQLYAAVYAVADEPLRNAMDLADLCAQRPADILGVKRWNIVKGNLMFRTRKTGAFVTVQITGELAVLMERLLAFRENPDRSKTLSAHAALRQHARSLPSSLQGAPVGMVAAATERLPREVRAAHYAELRQLALSLPDEQLGVALRELPFGLVMLPREHHAHELQLLEPALLRVLPEQRVQVAQGLLKWTYLLDDALSKHVWQRTLQLLDGSSATALLEALSKVGAALKTPKWQDAVNEVTAFMDRNRFTEQERATINAHMLLLRHPQDRMP